jgi:hypothetical protein
VKLLTAVGQDDPVATVFKGQKELIGHIQGVRQCLFGCNDVNQELLGWLEETGIEFAGALKVLGSLDD